MFAAAEAEGEATGCQNRVCAIISGEPHSLPLLNGIEAGDSALKEAEESRCDGATTLSALDSGGRHSTSKSVILPRKAVGNSPSPP